MFVGRNEELDLLRQENWKDHSQLIVIYGRRRVGKTVLVEKAFENEIVWKFEGIENDPSSLQIKNFLLTLSFYAQSPSMMKLKIDTWQEALMLLDKHIGNKPLILFFDEFQWMAASRTQFVSVFKWAWDNFFKKHINCKFVICGSVSSFIVNKVLRSRALYGRIDMEIDLKPFPLHEIKCFFREDMLPGEVLETAMIVGGIPQYLLQLEPGKSLAQNIAQMAFTPNGYFYKEYYRLFISHFAHNVHYESICRHLSFKSSLTMDELAKVTGNKTGGSFSTMIQNLELAGFIEGFRSIDRSPKSRIMRFRIRDEFLHFYYYFIDKNRAAIEARTFKPYPVLTGAQFDQWKGYAFERLCRNNAHTIAEYLGFSGIQYLFGSWFNRSSGVQIDLLFDRADKVMTICECKYTTKLDSKLIPSVEKKVSVIKELFHQHGIQIVLILGKKIPIPAKVNNYFHSIIIAGDVFL